MQSLASNEFVLDASAFYSGIPFLSGSKCYTTALVFTEIKHIKKSYSALEALIDAGNLEVVNPLRLFLKIVMDIAKKTGDFHKLSSADVSILALALQLKKTLISGDYAVQNIATVLDVPVKSVGTKGITKIRKWVSVCRTCGKGYEANIIECTLCGNKLTRRFKESKYKKPYNR